MNSANMWGRPIKVGRPTQAQPYLKTIESTVAESKRSACLYISGIHPVSTAYAFLAFLSFLIKVSQLLQIYSPELLTTRNRFRKI